MKKSAATIYLDHAATTYLDPEVKSAMEPYWDIQYGNPSSVCHLGRVAQGAVQGARDTVANCLHAKANEILFTAGGTESINLALFGVFGVYASSKRAHIITLGIEHSAVLRSCEALAQKGHEVTYVPVDKEGCVLFDKLKQAVRKETALISIMYANNEIGTIQPIKEIGTWLKILNREREEEGLSEILFHSDACQAGGSLDMDVTKLGVDLLTLNGSKIYGPKQTGILYVRNGIRLAPLVYGGGQERNVRSGTENVPGIVGLAKALELAQANQVQENKRLESLRDYAIYRIGHEISDIRINGVAESDNSNRLPNNIHISFGGVSGKSLLLYLDQQNICVSTGSACSAKDDDPSHVLQAISCPAQYIGGSIRITLGKRTTKEDIDHTIDVLILGVEGLRQASLVTYDLAKVTGSSSQGSCIEMTE